MRAWVWMVALGACSDPEPADLAPLDLAAGAVRYRLAWDDTGLASAEPGFTFTNDFGHLVHIEAGWLSSYAAQLVPCPETTLAQRVLSWIGIGTAHAGHSGEDDPSATPQGRVESLTDRKELVWHEGTYLIETSAYCKAHYLAARAEPDTPGLPDQPPLVGQSLYLAGTITPPGGSPRPFEFTMALASGRIGLLATDDEVEPVDPTTTGIEVRIVRDLFTLLRGLDLLGAPADLERTVTLRLAEAIRLEVRLISQ